MTSSWLSEFPAWFRNQKASIRLDVLTALLQMLHPLELRFIGSCVEELARKDYECLRDCERRYNSENIGAELVDLADGRCRSKLLVALCLLRSGNHVTADVIYRCLMSLNTVYHKLPKTKEVLDEVLLLLAMAKHHPAFRFSQYIDIEELAENISRFWRTGSSCKNDMPSSRRPPSPSRNASCQQLPPLDTEESLPTTSGSQNWSERIARTMASLNSGRVKPDGFNRSLPTTLLIVRPGATAMEKFRQSNLRPSEHAPKLLDQRSIRNMADSLSLAWYPRFTK